MAGRPAHRRHWHGDGERAPSALSTAEIAELVQAFADAAKRAKAIGIEAVELHAAHGYLLHQFLSPIANQRDDAYGGDFEGRIRFPLEVLSAVRAVFDGPVGLRVFFQLVYLSIEPLIRNLHFLQLSRLHFLFV